jgi:TatA/E family protein of Tat protein translocase
MGLGTSEIILIILFVLIFFGANKIPEFARGLGKGLREFKKATDDIKSEIYSSTSDIKNEVNEVKNNLTSEIYSNTSDIKNEVDEVKDNLNRTVNS